MAPRIALVDLNMTAPIGQGGQGKVYGVARYLTRPVDTPLVYKEYNPQVLPTVVEPALDAFVAYLDDLNDDDAQGLLTMAAWPCAVVERSPSGPAAGFLMPQLPDAFFTTINVAGGPRRVPGEFQHLLNSQDVLDRRGIKITDRERHLLLAQVAHSLVLLHRSDIVVGDISAKNLLFSLTPNPRVYFLDCDAMRIAGRSVTPQRETPNWRIVDVFPGEELATRATDAYKLGLLALRLFAGSQDACTPSAMPDRLPQSIRTLIMRALTHSPAMRPAPAAWVPVLLETAAALPADPPRTPAPAQVPAPRPTEPKKGLGWGDLARGAAVILAVWAATRPGDN